MRKLIFTILLLCVACDQRVDKGDDKLTEGSQRIQVTYKGSAQTVEFDDLETLTIMNNLPVVRLSDIACGSGLVLDASALWFNFIGTDGYTPIGNPNCVSPYMPTPGSIASQGYIERGTRRLIWEESLGIAPCVFVKDVATIQLADSVEELDTGGDTDSEPDTDLDTDSSSATVDQVALNHNGTIYDVSLGDLPQTTLGDKSVVLVQTIIESAGIQVDLNAAQLSFEGADGYNPTEKGTCTEHLPASGSLANQCGIDPSSGLLEWDPALQVANCAFIKDLAIIYVTAP